MTNPFLNLSCALSVAAALFAGCANEPSPQRTNRISLRPTLPPSDDAGQQPTVPVDADAGQPQPSSEPSFEPFEIAIDQSVTVGAFVLGIEKAAVSLQRTLFDERAKIEIAFAATNSSTALHEPLDSLRSEEFILEIEGEYFFAEVYTDDVPGLRQGAGTLTWIVPTLAITPEQIRAGVITLGGADSNAVVIPLADPASTVGLNDIPLDVAFVIQGHRDSTLEITSARVEFGSREENEPYQAGKARLVLLGGLSAAPNWENWQSENTALLRPDGVTVAAYHFNELVTEQPRDSIEIQFDLVQPVSGTYEFVVIDEMNGESTAQLIVVP